MAVTKEDCTRIEMEEGTIGGATYYVRHPKWNDEERAICFRPTRWKRYDDDGNPFPVEHCERPAGMATQHEGQGACKTHGGGPRNNGINGMRADVAVRQMKSRVEEYKKLGMAQLLDLSEQLAAARVVFEDMIDMFPDSDHDDWFIYVDRLMKLIDSIAKVADKISKMESRNAITINQILYLRARIADILVKWIKDPDDIDFAIADLATAIPDSDFLGKEKEPERIRKVLQISSGDD